MRGSRFALAGVLAAAAALVALGLGVGTDAALGASCADFPNQAAAQRAANTRDGDGDGIYCETLPCPCLKGGGGSSGGSGGRAPAGGGTRAVVEPQPAPGTCHMRGKGETALPDPKCTPGATNPAVTTATLSQTICMPGWTKTVRPPESVTSKEKEASMLAYGLEGPKSAYEYDHLIPLELGGATNSAKNLWPEPNTPGATGFYRNPKDKLENALKHAVCSGWLSLRTAQRLIASNWVAALRKYV